MWGGGHDFVCSSSLLVDTNGSRLSGRFIKITSHFSHIPKDKNKQFAILMLGNFIQGCTIFARAAFLRQCLPIPDFMRFHDYWFAINAAARNGFFCILKPLVLYLRHPNQVTAAGGYSSAASDGRLNGIKKGREWLEALQCSLDLSEECKRIMRDAIKLTGRQGHKEWFKAAYIFRHCGMRYFAWWLLLKAWMFLKGRRGRLSR